MQGTLHLHCILIGLLLGTHRETSPEFLKVIETCQIHWKQLRDNFTCDKSKWKDVQIHLYIGLYSLVEAQGKFFPLFFK